MAPGSKATAPLGRDVTIANSSVSGGRESLSPPQQAGSRELRPQSGSLSHQPVLCPKASAAFQSNTTETVGDIHIQIITEDHFKCSCCNLTCSTPDPTSHVPHPQCGVPFVFFTLSLQCTMPAPAVGASHNHCLHFRWSPSQQSQERSSDENTSHLVD